MDSLLALGTAIIGRLMRRDIKNLQLFNKQIFRMNLMAHQMEYLGMPSIYTPTWVVILQTKSFWTAWLISFSYIIFVELQSPSVSQSSFSISIRPPADGAFLKGGSTLNQFIKKKTTLTDMLDRPTEVMLNKNAYTLP